MLHLKHESWKVGITGSSGCGKSTFGLRLLSGAKARCKFIFDHKGEFSLRLGIPPVTSVAGLAAAAASPWCLFQPHAMFKGRLPDAFLFFCDFAYEVAGDLPGRKLFVVDELQLFTSTNHLAPEVAAIWEDGRIRGLDAVWHSSQVNIVHNRIRNQTTEVVTFNQADGTALAWLQEFGFDPAAVRGLPRGRYLSMGRYGGATVAGKVF